MMRVKKVVGIDRPSPDWVFWLLKNAGTTIPKSLFPFNTLFPLPPPNCGMPIAECGLKNKNKKNLTAEVAEHAEKNTGKLE
jgi:hypothetical protein